MERNTKIIELIRKMATIRSCFLDSYISTVSGDEIKIKILTVAFDTDHAREILNELDCLIRLQKINNDFSVLMQIESKTGNVSWSIPRKRNQSFLFKHYGNNFYHSLITLQT